MRSVIIAEVSFFSDQNSPKNFSQKCKKILLPTLTFLIRNQGTQKSCLHKVKLTVCMLSAQYIAAMQVPFPIFYMPHYKKQFICLSLPFFKTIFFVFKQVMMAGVRYLSINRSYTTKWQIAGGQYSILLHLCALTAMQKEYGHICL